MTLLVVIIILALIFDYINGFHDAANSIATVVSTKVLTPFQAVIWAAVFNFVAYFIFQDHAVANTIGKTVQQNFITLPVILSGLIAAIAWNLLTWWYGIPSSSSHTLIGGLMGAGITHAYMTKGATPIGDILVLENIIGVVIFIFLSPLIGMVISMFITIVTMNKNTWLRIGIILVATAGTFFLFNYFEQNKIAKNVEKFYKIDKYEKDLAKNPGDEEAKKKLEKAKANFEKAKPLFASYDKAGAGKIAAQINEMGLLKGIGASKCKDAVLKYLGVDSLKRRAALDSNFKPEYEKANAAFEKVKDLAAGYAVTGAKVADTMAAVLQLTPAETEKFSKAIAKVNAEKDLLKEIEKADNSIIMWCMIGVIAIFILSYIWVEKIKNPNAYKVANMFKRLQLLTSAAFSVGHGGNDAQKVMGVIGAAFVAYNSNKYPDVGAALKDLGWVPLACYTAIGLGTMSGGWKIVKTMGTKITKVTPLEGVAAETAGALTLFMTEQLGKPVSTTHTITGAIIGVGATKRLSAVRWGVTVNLLWAWILTIPVSALLAALVYYIVSLFGG
ncbi:MAG: PiT family inorganic phosphate transporter [Ferruginibacter sp.]